MTENNGNGAAGLAVLGSHHPIGASTGLFYKEADSWADLVRSACSVSVFAAELSALSEPELFPLVNYLHAQPMLPFRYLSVHAPVKARSLDDDEMTEALVGLPTSVRAIVAHPDEIEDFAAYRRLGRRLLIENMDLRKKAGRTADELDEFFTKLPDAGFCFDIAHAHSVDPTMSVATDLLDRFRDRLREVHLSSLEDGKHVPLTIEDEALFAPYLARCSDVPWILEAPAPDRWNWKPRQEPVGAGKTRALG